MMSRGQERGSGGGRGRGRGGGIGGGRRWQLRRSTGLMMEEVVEAVADAQQGMYMFVFFYKPN